jgi:divalent metal cation (Fe/Co/Zn/Cd) transporter
MTTTMHPVSATEERRELLARRGRALSLLTLGYNSLEGLISVAAGVSAGSISLVGFGVDSVIEVLSSVAALWRLRADFDEARRERAERAALRVIGVLFVGLAVYIAVDAAYRLYRREAASISRAGLAITVLSVIVMPLLARAKRNVATALGSRALTADSTQTDLCAWLSAIVLVGLALNAALGWWWADPVAAICMTPIIAKEGFEALRGEPPCEDCA